MHRPYISGPMTGVHHHNFPKFFRVEELLRSSGLDPINPARNTGDTWVEAYQHAMDHPKTWEHYIRRDLKGVLEADGVVLLDGWTASKGACIEAVVSIMVGGGLAKFQQARVDGDWTLLPIDREYTYNKALAYLKQCGLGGVNLTAGGYVKYL